jgi:tetrahydromethanopterin S-methyltransferase subunit E
MSRRLTATLILTLVGTESLYLVLTLVKAPAWLLVGLTSLWGITLGWVGATRGTDK